MQKISTTLTSGKNLFQGQLTIGLDLGDRSSAYCVLDGTGEIVLEHKLATMPEAMKQVFASMPRCRIAMETGTHSPWVSRLLAALGHEVIVGHAQKVRLITKSRRKDDRLDARTLARLARIDPALLSPVQHRSAEAQLHLAEIRARAVLVSARTALINAARGLQHLLNREHPTGTGRKPPTKNADGRVATEAAWRIGKNRRTRANHS